MAETATCPHGDPSCPCPDEHDGNFDPCHYEGLDAFRCPSTGLTTGHCHIEGCSWHLVTDEPEAGNRVGRTEGECGLLKLGLPPVIEDDNGSYYSMTQARPGLPGWACGWLRTPLNVDARERGRADVTTEGDGHGS